MNGETPLGWQVSVSLNALQTPFAKKSKSLLFDTKKFSEKRANFVFVKSKEWIVQLKPEDATGTPFIPGIQTESVPVASSGKVKNKPLMRS